jgi:hypothetical protein
MIQEIKEMVVNTPAEASWNIATQTSTATRRNWLNFN